MWPYKGNDALYIAGMPDTVLFGTRFAFTKNIILVILLSYPPVFMPHTCLFSSSKRTFSQPFQEKCMSEVAKIGSIIIFHLSKP